jgi:hypothetical protein
MCLGAKRKAWQGNELFGRFGWRGDPTVAAQGRGRHPSCESHVLMKSRPKLRENGLRFRLVRGDGLGTQVSYPVFKGGNYWHAHKHATGKRVVLYTFFCRRQGNGRALPLAPVKGLA